MSRKFAHCLRGQSFAGLIDGFSNYSVTELFLGVPRVYVHAYLESRAHSATSLPPVRGGVARRGAAWRGAA